MPKIIQLAGSSGSNFASELGKGLMAYQSGLADYKEREAKTALAKEQAREKKLKSDQIEAYDAAVSGFGTQAGETGATAPGFTGPQEVDSYKNTIFWKSDVATELREAQESGKGAYPDYIMNSGSVQQALWDVEAVYRASQRAGLHHPEASVRTADDKALQDALDAKLRAVQSALHLETARVFESKKQSFMGEILTVKDDSMDAVYGDKLREMGQQVDDMGHREGLQLLENLRDEFYEQLTKKQSYEQWAHEASKHSKSPEAVNAYAAYLERTEDDASLGGVDAQTAAQMKFHEFANRTLTDEELNDPAKASEAFEKAKTEWTGIQLAIGNIDGVPRQTYEAQAENDERRWLGAFGTLQALHREDDQARSLVAQLRHLKETAPVPKGMDEGAAALFRMEYAAQTLNGLLSERGKSTLPSAFLHGLLGQDDGSYSIHQVSDENLMIDRPYLLGDSGAADEAALGDKAQTAAPLRHSKAPQTLRSKEARRKSEIKAGEAGQDDYVEGVQRAATYEGVVAAVKEKAKYDTLNMRQGESFLTSGHLWEDRAIPMDQTDEQVDAYVAGRLERLEREFQDESGTQVYPFTTLSGNTAELRRAITAMKRLPKENRLMWLLKAEEQLIDTPRNLTDHLGPYKGSGTPLDVVRGIKSSAEGITMDTHDITILAYRMSRINDKRISAGVNSLIKLQNRINVATKGGRPVADPAKELAALERITEEIQKHSKQPLYGTAKKTADEIRALLGAN